MRRPAHWLLLFLLLCTGAAYALGMASRVRAQVRDTDMSLLLRLTESFALSDLCLTTEARYTRHPAVSDHMTPFMDHPGAIEHFPSGSFWAPPPGNR